MVERVLLQLDTPREPLAAHRAHVRPLPRVHAPVLRQVAGGGERPGTHHALVRLLARVGAPVDLQVARGHEGLPAVGAQERLLARVDAHVHGQVAAHGESPSAVRALEGLLARVAAHVPLQDLLALEGFAAFFTDLRLTLMLSGPSVDLHLNLDLVRSELAHASARLDTLQALEGPGLGLCHPRERFPALGTPEPPRLLLGGASVPESLPDRFEVGAAFDAEVSRPGAPAGGEVDRQLKRTDQIAGSHVLHFLFGGATCALEVRACCRRLL